MHGLLLALLLIQAPVTIQNQNGTVTGQLRGVNAQPAAGVRVAAMAIPEAGQAISSGTLASIAETDTDGRYRLENIPPGRYYVIAGLVNFPTYYPGATGVAAAREVEVTAQKAVEGIDFDMRRPAAVRVTGRLVGIPDPLLLTVTMLGGGSAPLLQASVNADGSFEFPKVPLGTWSIRAPGAVTTSVIVDEKDLHIDLKPQYEGPGVKVRGTVVGASNLLPAIARPTVMLNRLATITAGNAFSDGGTLTLEVPIGSDGTFEFAKVPAGSYTLRTNPTIPGPFSRFDVGDTDMTGVTIQVPFQLELAGRLVTEGAPPPARSMIQFTRGTASSATSADSGGFRVRLAEGDYQVAITQLPLGYLVKSIMFAGTDITRSTLKIDSSTVPAEIVVTLGTVSLDSIPGVKVSGRVTNTPAGTRIGLFSLIPSAVTSPPETEVKTDGTFEFLKVAPGNYMVRVLGRAPVLRPGQIRVDNQDITDLLIEVMAMVDIGGRIIVTDAAGNRIAPPAGLFVGFRRTNGMTSTVVRPDGVFTMALQEGEHAIVVNNLPPGYAIKSITSGTVELTGSVLKALNSMPSPDIQITLGYAPQP